MKWTDLALVFCTVFLALALLVDFSFRAEKQVLYTTEEYNRILDRVTEDAMTDTVLYESEEGAVLDENKVLKQLNEEICFLFEGKTEEERMKILSCIKAVILTERGRFTVYEYEGDDDEYSIGIESGDRNPFVKCENAEELSWNALNDVFEQYLPGKLSIAQIEKEDWYQEVGPLEMFVIFQNDDAVFPRVAGLTTENQVYVRITRSAAVVRKEGNY